VDLYEQPEKPSQLFESIMMSLGAPNETVFDYLKVENE